ncbi:sterol O-acyltransferase [Rhizophagus irregularis DAOM 181602=DAOM 197198]|nr:sterol O-acyltransferase [Rhizophagus irregularis DAOM 181602=DAOM 197198]
MLQNTQAEDIISVKKHTPSIKSTITTTTTSLSATLTYDDELNRLPRKIAKRVVTFQPRSSQLDRETLDSHQYPFRGFFTLFWIAMGFYIIQTGVKNFQSAGILLDLTFFRLFSQDALGLILSDACMVGSMFFAVLLQKAIAHGWIRWRYTGMIIQHIFQITFLFVPIYWTFFKGWPWVQSGFFVLHTISMLMKLHSYSFYNDEKKEDEKQQILDQLKSKIEQVEGYLHSPAGNIRYPENVTFANYVDFLLVPTLVYELEYPRTEKIRPWYLFEKILATFGTFFLLYVNTETYIIPVLPNVSTSIYNAMCICNVFAELTCFADRNFYDDWWNSTTWDEFARKWNKPVHHFLLRHVYQSSIESYKLSKRDATFMTFFLSSLIHELVMVVVSKKIRMYLFFLQMFQLPLIWLSKLPEFYIVEKYLHRINKKVMTYPIIFDAAPQRKRSQLKLDVELVAYIGFS